MFGVILLISVLLICSLLKSMCTDIYDEMKKGYGVVFRPPIPTLPSYTLTSYTLTPA